MTQILCTIDFTESSRDALRWAAMLTKQLKAHLTILYTFRLIKMPFEEAVGLKKKMEVEAKDNFTQIEKEILKGSGVSYDFKVEVGFVVHRIEELIKNQTIDFLIIDKRIPGNKEALDELIAKVSVPMVLVP
ncbi:MAG: universal stress protein [Cyclobacteriaceae bacterium]|nr:universal stress protein [Cyclobacteriaceae bacterium]